MAEWNDDDDDDADRAAIDKVSRRSDKLDTHLMKDANDGAWIVWEIHASISYNNI